MLVMLGAPLVAPGIGVALLGFGWGSIFVFLAAYAVIVLIERGQEIQVVYVAGHWLDVDSLADIERAGSFA